MSDDDLIRGCIRKDPTIVEALSQRFSPTMLEVCYRYIRDEIVAKNVLRRAFKRAYDRIKEFKGEISLESWIRGIVKDTAISTLSDEELVKGCLKGERALEFALYNRYAGKMLTVCRRYARHQAEAKDMFHDGMLKTFLNLKSFKGEGSLEGWIRRIMINTALGHIKKMGFQNEDIGLGDHENENSKSIDPKVFANIEVELLIRIINQLPDGYRMVLNLNIDGFSHKEIGEQLGIGESTSRSQLVKARRMLKKMYDDLEH